MPSLPRPPADDPWLDTPHEVFLCNFGGPERANDVEPFLRRLFEDPFIIRAPLPNWLRRLLARRIARRRRGKATAEYEAIGYSPLNRLTQIQAAHLEAVLRTRRPQTRVSVVNRYMPPLARDVAAQIDPRRARVFAITLYPHFCHSTTVSSLRDLELAFGTTHGCASFPGTRVYSWWAEPRFLAMTAKALEATIAPILSELAHGVPLTIIASAHGLPKRYPERGDPYVGETKSHFQELERRTNRWLTQASAAAAKSVTWRLAFQSRVGPVEWVGPYTSDVIAQEGSARGGILVLVPISFTSDHIETLWEMDRVYAPQALANGFARVLRTKPANDAPELAHCLADALMRHGF